MPHRDVLGERQMDVWVVQGVAEMGCAQEYDHQHDGYRRQVSADHDWSEELGR